jgi:hypothetical protein
MRNDTGNTETTGGGDLLDTAHWRSLLMEVKKGRAVNWLVVLGYFLIT